MYPEYWVGGPEKYRTLSEPSVITLGMEPAEF